MKTYLWSLTKPVDASAVDSMNLNEIARKFNKVGAEEAIGYVIKDFLIIHRFYNSTYDSINIDFAKLISNRLNSLKMCQSKMNVFQTEIKQMIEIY